MLQGRDLLGEHDRVMRRQHENRRPELDARCDRCGMGERDQRLGPAHAVEAPRGEQVVRDEQRLKPKLLGMSCETPQLFAMDRVLPWQQVGGQKDAELQVETIVWWPSRCLKACACPARAAMCMTTRHPADFSTRRAGLRHTPASPTPPSTWWPMRWLTPTPSGPPPWTGIARWRSGDTSGATALESPKRWTPRSAAWDSTGRRPGS